MRAFDRRPWLLLLLPVLACWPVWQWMAQRALDRSEDPWELLGLATAALLVWRCGSPRQTSNASLLVPALWLTLYAASYTFAPPLIRAALATIAIAALISTLYFQRRMHWPLLGLLLLSLPIIASLNFYLGYPLRVMTGAASAALLQMNGFAVVREGALLAWNGQLISVDAPCSGIKMLWTGCYLCCTLAAFQRLNAAHTALLCLLGFAVVMLSNILRASALFYVESDIVGVQKTWHTGIGVAIFIVTVITITTLAHIMGKRQHAH